MSLGPRLEQVRAMLEDVRTSLWSTMNRLVQRGHTAEYLLEESRRLEASSRAFDDEVERRVVPWYWRLLRYAGKSLRRWCCSCPCAYVANAALPCRRRTHCC